VSHASTSPLDFLTDGIGPRPPPKAAPARTAVPAWGAKSRDPRGEHVWRARDRVRAGARLELEPELERRAFSALAEDRSRNLTPGVRKGDGNDP
jgi:hypothetical protein